MGRAAAFLGRICSHILQFAVVLFGVTLLTFSIMHFSPKNPAELWLAGPDGNVGTVSEEAIREQERVMGLDRPFAEQYLSWLSDALRGDLGLSYTSKKPVSEEIISHMEPTLEMTFISLGITVAVSVPLGILCAVYRDRAIDNILRIYSFIGISVPSFVLSLIFLWVFCIKLNFVSVIAPDGIKGLILPISVLVIQCSAKMIRQVRAIVLEQMGQPYVDGAIIRGVCMRDILFRHVLKNCAAPVLTCVSIYVGIFLGGSTVIEGIFSVNGLGKLAVSAVNNLDYNMIQGFVLWCAVSYLIVNLAVDILSALIDPRIKYGRM